MASLSLAAFPAEAGSYSPPTYGGNGAATQMVNNAPKAVSYGPTSSGWGGGSGGVPSASCTGSIAASFTWQPASSSDTPPSQVIATETCTASASVAVPQQTGKYNTGLGTGSAPTGTVTCVPGGSQNSISGTSVRYTAQPGGQTAALQVVNPSSSGGGYGSSSTVGYTASVSPVTISLSGTTPVSGVQYGLTGQQITATLQGIPGNFTVTKYTWAAGGSTFKNYDPTQKSNQLVALGSGDLTGPASGSTAVTPLAFYDSAAESLTVTCTLAVTAPDGSTLNFTASSPTINVLKPTLTNEVIVEGYVQLASDGSAFGLYGNLSGTGNSTNGMIWSNFTVNVPAPFPGNGQCTFTQLVNPDHLEYVNGSSTPIGSNNGILGLDGSFEYGTPWNVTGTGNDADSPNQPLFYRTGLTEISVSDAFTTYVMYQPSGGVWVPLDKFSWMYGMTLNWVPQTSQFSLAASYPASVGQAGSPTPTTTTSPPQWSVIQASE